MLDRYRLVRLIHRRCWVTSWRSWRGPAGPWIARGRSTATRWRCAARPRLDFSCFCTCRFNLIWHASALHSFIISLVPFFFVLWCWCDVVSIHRRVSNFKNLVRFFAKCRFRFFLLKRWLNIDFLFCPCIEFQSIDRVSWSVTYQSFHWPQVFPLFFLFLHRVSSFCPSKKLPK